MALTYYYVTDAGAGSADGSSIANAMSYSRFTDYMVTGGSFTAAPGDVFRIIGAITSRTTTTDTWVNGGNATSPVMVEGWTSGGTTAYAGRTNGNGALITTDFPTIVYTTGRLNVTGTFIIVKALSITGASTSSTIATSTEGHVVQCSIVHTGTGASIIALNSSGARSIIIDNDISTSGASGGSCALNVSASARVIGNRLTTVQAIPAILTTAANANLLCVNNVIYSGGGVGISMGVTSGSLIAIGNTIYGCAGDGIDVITGTTATNCVIGNMITDNGGYGVDFNSTSVAGFVAYNHFRDNTSGTYSPQSAGTPTCDWVLATRIGDIASPTGSPADDYVNAGSLDFNLIAASPATSASLPQFASMGALQRDQTSSGGGGGLRLAGHGGLAA